MRAAIVAIFAAASLALGATAALAQYPPPAGNIAVVPTDPDPPVGGETPFTIKLLSQAGVNESGTVCSARVASQPGAGAFVVPESFVTAVDGSANLTLHSGSAAGEVKVEVKCGEHTALATFAVGSTNESAPAGAPQLPPLPPATGESTSRDSSSLPLAALFTIVGAAGLASVFGVRRLRARS